MWHEYVLGLPLTTVEVHGEMAGQAHVTSAKGTIENQYRRGRALHSLSVAEKGAGRLITRTRSTQLSQSTSLLLGV